MLSLFYFLIFSTINNISFPWKKWNFSLSTTTHVRLNVVTSLTHYKIYTYTYKILIWVQVNIIRELFLIGEMLIWISANLFNYIYKTFSNNSNVLLIFVSVKLLNEILYFPLLKKIVSVWRCLFFVCVFLLVIEFRNGWLIRTASKSFAVYAATSTEKQEWMAHINKCIEDLLRKSKCSCQTLLHINNDDILCLQVLLFLCKSHLISCL